MTLETMVLVFENEILMIGTLAVTFILAIVTAGVAIYRNADNLRMAAVRIRRTTPRPISERERRLQTKHIR